MGGRATALQPAVPSCVSQAPCAEGARQDVSPPRPPPPPAGAAPAPLPSPPGGCKAPGVRRPNPDGSSLRVLPQFLSGSRLLAPPAMGKGWSGAEGARGGSRGRAEAFRGSLRAGGRPCSPRLGLQAGGLRLCRHLRTRLWGHPAAALPCLGGEAAERQPQPQPRRPRSPGGSSGLRARPGAARWAPAATCRPRAAAPGRGE